MRIIVISDSHGFEEGIRQVLNRRRGADLLIFLGDGYRDLEAIRYETNIPVKAVAGNGDFFCNAPLTEQMVLEGKRFFCTHGHMYHVKFGTENLIKAAKEQNTDILLYGHTHIVQNTYEDGMYILNPGSLKQGSFATIDLTDNGVFIFTDNLFSRS